MKNSIEYVNACADAAWQILCQRDPLTATLEDDGRTESWTKQIVRSLVAIDAAAENGGYADYERLTPFVVKGDKDKALYLISIVRAWSYISAEIYESADNAMVRAHSRSILGM